MLDVGSSPEKKFPRKSKKKNYFLAIGPSIYGLTACLPFCLCIDVGQVYIYLNVFYINRIVIALITQESSLFLGYFQGFFWGEEIQHPAPAVFSLDENYSARQSVRNLFVFLVRVVKGAAIPTYVCRTHNQSLMRHYVVSYIKEEIKNMRWTLENQKPGKLSEL